MSRTELREDVEKEGLTEKQRRIVEIAIENSDWTNVAIAEEADVSPSYVSDIHRRFLDRTVQPNQVTTADLDNYDIYEKIVAGIESIKGVQRIEQKYDLALNAGGSKEVDVAAWIEQAGREIMLTIECKDENKPVKQEVVSGAIDHVNNSRADRAAVVAREGFQSGAIERAESSNADLFTVRELRQGDLDGRITEVHTKVGVFPSEARLLNIDLYPADEDILEDVKGKNVTPYINQTPDLYNRNRRPTGETVFDLANEFLSNLSPGTHTTEIGDRLMLLDGDFYELRAITVEVQRGPFRTVREDRMNAYEANDLFFKDEFKPKGEDDIRLYTIEEALRAFVDNAS